MSNSPCASKNTLLTKAAQVGKSQHVDSAWKVTELTIPVKRKMLDAFYYAGLEPKEIQRRFWNAADGSPSVRLICEVIRNNSRPVERIA